MARLWAEPLISPKARPPCTHEKLITYMYEPKEILRCVYLPPCIYLRPRSQSYAATKCFFPCTFSIGPAWSSLSKKTTTELVAFPSLLELPRSHHAPNTFPHLRASYIVAAMGCWQLILCTTKALWLVAVPVRVVAARGAAGLVVAIGCLTAIVSGLALGLKSLAHGLAIGISCTRVMI